ncbi:cation transporter [Flavobacteriaceae bacterium]|jgi:Cu+-exporting ATPase|nr:cation transporter [Flavobacteriaceae bacterium]
MKHLKTILASAFILVLLFSCKNEAKAEIKTVETATEKAEHQLDPNAIYSKAEFGIKGMTCEMGCAKTIEKKLAAMEGVKSATVDFKNEMAMIEYDVAKVNPVSITKTVSSVGKTYSVENMKTVEAFSSFKKDCKKDCKKACCKDKNAADKKTCANDCKKECCAKKA